MSLAIAAPSSLSVPPQVMAPVPASLPVLSPGQRGSTLVIADQLITLAEHADRAGFQSTASSIVKLVFTVLDEHGVPN